MALRNVHLLTRCSRIAGSTHVSRFCSVAYDGIPQSGSEPSTSSGAAGRVHVLDGFDVDLLEAARKRVFIPPRGSYLDECWARMNDIIESASGENKAFRIGDILLLANSLLLNDRLVCVSSSELVEVIQSRVRQRSRLPNVFTLIQYLRFLSATDARPFSVQALTLTVQLAPQIRISELIEIASLMTRSKWIHSASRHEVIDLLSVIADRLGSVDDTNAFSESNHRNGERLVAYFFTEFFDSADMTTPRLRDAWLRLVINVMADRHCASAEALDKMIEIGLSLWETGYQDEAKYIATAIRDHQLSRAFIIKPLLRDEDRRIKLAELSNLTKVTLSVYRVTDMIRFGPAGSDSSKGLTGLYRRVLPDLNGAPQYRKGSLFLYYSPSTSCWQISTDVTRDFGRIAFIPGSASEFPIAKQGWQVFSRAKYSFVDCSYDLVKFTAGDELSRTPGKGPKAVKSAPIGLKSSDTEPQDDQEPHVEQQAEDLVDSILDEWSSTGQLPREADETNTKRLVELEQTVAELQAKLNSLEASLENKFVNDPIPAASPAQAELGNSGLISAIGSKLADMIRPELTQVGGPRSFEATREEQLRQDRLAGQAKMISRKLRSPY